MCYQPKNCKEINEKDFSRLPGVEDLKKNLRIEFRELNNLPDDLWKYKEFISNKEDLIWKEKYNSLVNKFGVRLVSKYIKMYDPSGVSCYTERFYGGRDFEDLNKEQKNLNFVKRKLLENISFFSDLKLEEKLEIFQSKLISKLQDDLSNLSNENCTLKETAKLILEYNKIVEKFMIPEYNLGYIITPFFERKE